MKSNNEMLQIVNTITKKLRQLESDILLMQMQINGKLDISKQSEESIHFLQLKHNKHLQNIKFMEGQFIAYEVILKKINEMKDEVK